MSSGRKLGNILPCLEEIGFTELGNVQKFGNIPVANKHIGIHKCHKRKTHCRRSKIQTDLVESITILYMILLQESPQIGWDNE